MQVFEKIIEKLNTIGWVYAEYYEDNKYSMYSNKKSIPLKDAIDAVNQVSEEYNNGYIPVSERLPGESNFYCATVEDTATGGRCEQTVWFAHEDDYYGESEWRGLCNYEKVVAWKESAPYQPKGEQE